MNGNSNSQTVVAIIPGYNEETHISGVISATKKYVDEIIVVDDGSIDNTYLAAKQSEADFILKHVINMGKGVALKTGFEAALLRNADIIITIDSDGQHNPEDIPRLLDEINKGYDIVVGGRPFNKNMPSIFKFGNWFIQKSFQKLFKLMINDTQSGYRAFRAEAYRKILWQSQRYSVEAEMLANAGKYNLKVKEIPIRTVYLDNVKGTTVFDGIKIFLNMLKWKLHRR